MKPEIVKIDIDDHSVIHWQGVAVSGDADLEAKLQALAAQPVAPEIHLRPDKSARYAVVAKVLADTKRVGLTRIGVIGGEQFVE